MRRDTSDRLRVFGSHCMSALLVYAHRDRICPRSAHEAAIWRCPSPARYTGYYRQNRPNRYSVFLAGSGGISGYLGAG
jgi:hypothetical protein